MTRFPAPAEGMVLTHFIVSDDVDRSRRFYTDVLGGEAVLVGEPTIVARVGEAIRETGELSEVQRRMSALGLMFDFRNSGQFQELIVTEHEKFGKIIREAGIQPN